MIDMQQHMTTSRERLSLDKILAMLQFMISMQQLMAISREI